LCCSSLEQPVPQQPQATQPPAPPPLLREHGLSLVLERVQRLAAAAAAEEEEGEEVAQKSRALASRRRQPLTCASWTWEAAPVRLLLGARNRCGHAWVGGKHHRVVDVDVRVQRRQPQVQRAQRRQEEEAEVRSLAAVPLVALLMVEERWREKEGEEGVGNVSERRFETMDRHCKGDSIAAYIFVGVTCFDCAAAGGGDRGGGG
jgi:hypothetical protein